MLPFGKFNLSGGNPSLVEIKSPFNWKIFPPPDVPKCGFFGEKCIAEKKKGSSNCKYKAPCFHLK